FVLSFLPAPPVHLVLTLFPYTTLFRSSYFHEALNWQTWQTGFLFVFSVQLDARGPFLPARIADANAYSGFRPAAPEGKARERPTDRKSTRLNSSHVAISYAVFCLKKKK